MVDTVLCKQWSLSWRSASKRLYEAPVTSARRTRSHLGGNLRSVGVAGKGAIPVLCAGSPATEAATSATPARVAFPFGGLIMLPPVLLGYAGLGSLPSPIYPIPSNPQHAAQAGQVVGIV